LRARATWKALSRVELYAGAGLEILASRSIYVAQGANGDTVRLYAPSRLGAMLDMGLSVHLF